VIAFDPLAGRLFTGVFQLPPLPVQIAPVPACQAIVNGWSTTAGALPAVNFIRMTPVP
jgi:hypothetical protein